MKIQLSVYLFHSMDLELFWIKKHIINCGMQKTQQNTLPRKNQKYNKKNE